MDLIMTEGMERLAAVIQETEKEVEVAEKALKQTKKALLDYQKELASQMDEKGISSFTTSAGVKVSVKDDLRVTLPADRSGAVKWLEDNGYGDILKRQVKVSLGRGVESTHPLLGFLRASGLPFEQKDDVPWQTLTKLCREIREEGGDFDQEKFNVYEVRLASIKTK